MMFDIYHMNIDSSFSLNAKYSKDFSLLKSIKKQMVLILV